MPEAAIDENGNAGGAKGDVDLSFDAWYDGAVQPESETHPMKLRAKPQLGLGVSSARRDHSVASFFG